MPGIIFNAVAIADLFDHLKIEHSPLMKALRSDARNMTAFEMSCGSSQATCIGFIAS